MDETNIREKSESVELPRGKMKKCLLEKEEEIARSRKGKEIDSLVEEEEKERNSEEEEKERYR